MKMILFGKTNLFLLSGLLIAIVGSVVFSLPAEAQNDAITVSVVPGVGSGTVTVTNTESRLTYLRYYETGTTNYVSPSPQMGTSLTFELTGLSVDTSYTVDVDYSALFQSPSSAIFTTLDSTYRGGDFQQIYDWVPASYSAGTTTGTPVAGDWDAVNGHLVVGYSRRGNATNPFTSSNVDGYNGWLVRVINIADGSTVRSFLGPTNSGRTDVGRPQVIDVAVGNNLIVLIAGRGYPGFTSGNQDRPRIMTAALNATALSDFTDRGTIPTTFTRLMYDDTRWLGIQGQNIRTIADITDPNTNSILGTFPTNVVPLDIVKLSNTYYFIANVTDSTTNTTTRRMISVSDLSAPGSYVDLGVPSFPTGNRFQYASMLTTGADFLAVATGISASGNPGQFNSYTGTPEAGLYTNRRPASVTSVTPVDLATTSPKLRTVISNPAFGGVVDMRYRLTTTQVWTCLLYTSPSPRDS